MTHTRRDRLLLVGAIVAIVALAIWRVVDHGMLPVAPDDAEYIGVGRRLVALQSPRGIDGTLFTIRSWVWPIMAGTASRLVPGDPFRGPEILGFVVGAGALVGSVVFAFRRAGALAAVLTAAALGCSAVVWEVATSTRVDVALMAFLVLTISLAAEPSPRRALLAGIAAGVTVLTKETSALLILLPLAWRGTMPTREWSLYTRRYVVAFVAIVGWWFVTVLVLRGEIFPLEGLRQAAGRQVPRAWSLDAAGLALVGVWVIAWIVLVAIARYDVGVRTLIVGAAAMVPAAAIALGKGFALRQFAPLALVSSIAVGLVVPLLITRAGGPRARSVGVACVGIAVAAAVVPIARVHDHATVVAAPPIERALAEWLGEHAPRDAAIASTFRFKAQVWARVGDRLDIRGLDFDQPSRIRSVAPTVWVDWRDGRFNTLSRAEFGRGRSGVRFLVLSGPHRLGPAALAVWLRREGSTVGLEPVAQFGALGGSAWIDVERVGRAPNGAHLPTIVTAVAVSHLSNAALARLPAGVVVAGPYGALVAATDRILARTGRAVAQLVAPAR